MPYHEYHVKIEAANIHGTALEAAPIVSQFSGPDGKSGGLFIFHVQFCTKSYNCALKSCCLYTLYVKV